MADIKVSLMKKDGSLYEVSRFNGLKSVRLKNESTPDASKISYGIFSGSGTVVISDFNETIKGLIENDEISSSDVATLVNFNGNQIKEGTTNDSDYNVNTKEFKINLSDSTANWDNLMYKGFDYPIDGVPKTAYQMIQDVFYNVGYMLETFDTWTIYTFEDAFDGFNLVGTNNSIEVTTSDGWEIIGQKLNVEKNKQHTIKFKYNISEAYTPLSGYSGIAAQVLNATPTSSNCSSISIQTVQLQTTPNTSGYPYEVTITFTPIVDTIYFVFNFGYAADGQTINFTAYDFELDGKSVYKTLDKRIVCRTQNFTEAIREYLDDIIIQYPYLESDTIRNTINKFCTLAQLNAFLDKNGSVKFVSARPIATASGLYPENVDVIKILPRNQYSEFRRNVIVKNKYKNVELAPKKIKEETGFNQLCYTYTTAIEDSSYVDSNSNSTFQQVYTTLSSNYRRTYAFIALYYKNFTFSISKNTNHNLDKVLTLYDGLDANSEPYIKYNVTYRVKRGTCVVTNPPQSGTAISSFNQSNTTRTYTSTSTDTTSTLSNSYSYTPNSSQYADYPTCTVSTTDNSTNSNTGIITEYNDRFEVTVKLLVKKEQFGVPIHAETAQSVWEYYTGEAELYVPDKIEISCYGDKRVIRFEELEQLTSSTASDSSIKITSNNLIQTTAVIPGIEMATLIKNNILNDYANGILNGELTVSCSDYYNGNGVRIKNWANGDVINTFDIVQIYKDTLHPVSYGDGTPIYWRVTGAQQRYSGCPYVDLELQEVKFI